MNYSYNWLAKHFDSELPAPEELGTIVGLHAFEYEGSEIVGSDTLLDWDVLPNRSSDALSYRGMAREIGAVLDIPFREEAGFVKGNTPFSKEKETSYFVQLAVDSGQDVLRATKRMALDVEVEESPQWLKDLLESIGQKSINNVVDITNYVMWETGQPVHAFDYDKLAGSEKDNVEITIRHAEDGEILKDLTGEKHTLDSSMIVIADGERALDIAGVKGGIDSGVDEKTTRVMLSACNFNYISVRNTARKLKLHTDASKRFENEVPLGKVEEAMFLLSRAMVDIAGATVLEEVLDTNPEPIVTEKIKLSVSTTNSILGTALSKEEISGYLARVGCDAGEGEDEFMVSVPPERLDITFAGDLIEEVGRLYGYEKLEPIMPEDGFELVPLSETQKAIRSISDTLVTLGFYEVKNRSIVEKGTVVLTNPLNKKRGQLRDTLTTNIMERAEKNLAYADEPRLFEIGKIWTGISDGLLEERWSFAGVNGRRKIKDKMKQSVFLETKGYLEASLEGLGLSGISYKASGHEILVADIYVGDKMIGNMWVNGWELDLEMLLGAKKVEVDYKKPSKYPRIDRDVAVFVPAGTSVASIMEMIQSQLPEEAVELSLFDVFEKDGKKSLAFRVVFQSDIETLSDEWANRAMDKVYDVLKQEGYEIR